VTDNENENNTFNASYYDAMEWSSVRECSFIDGLVINPYILLMITYRNI